MPPVPLISISRRPDITLCPDGRIDINARIAKTLSLQSGDVINIASANGEFFLYVAIRHDKCIGIYEGTVRPTHRGKFLNNNYRTYSKSLYQAICRVINGGKGKKIRLPAGKAVTLKHYGISIPLITRNPL